jgi:RNA polymerase sigma factor (sigma-70 family)
MADGAGGATKDAGLVQAVLAGDTTAYAGLYAAHVRAVRTVVQSNVHLRDDVADTVQEVFSRALERLATLRQPDRFRPWLLSIARHVAVDERRRVKVDSLAEEGPDEIASSGAGPAEEAELAELARLVHGSVAGLARRDALALSLAMHLGYTPTDMADTLGVTPGAAKVILHRARLRLRDAVAVEVLVRSHNVGCPDLAGVLHDDGPLPAARHIHGCPACLAAAGEEVQRYESPLRPARAPSAAVEPDHSDTTRAERIDQEAG